MVSRGDRYDSFIIDFSYPIPELPISYSTAKEIIRASNIKQVYSLIKADFVLTAYLLKYYYSNFYRYYVETTSNIPHVCDPANRLDAYLCKQRLIHNWVFIPSSVSFIAKTVGLEGLKSLVILLPKISERDRFYYAVYKHSQCFSQFMAFLIENVSVDVINRHKNDLIIGALLHDLGKLSLYISFKPKYIDIFGYTSENWSEIEQYLTNYDHRTIGEYITRVWNFPWILCLFSKYHCTPNFPDVLSGRIDENEIIQLISFFRIAHSVFIAKKPNLTDVKIIERLLHTDPVSYISSKLIDFNKPNIKFFEEEVDV